MIKLAKELECINDTDIDNLIRKRTSWLRYRNQRKQFLSQLNTALDERVSGGELTKKQRSKEYSNNVIQFDKQYVGRCVW